MAPIGQALRQLHISEIPKAVRVYEAAVMNDPLQRYVRNTPDADKSYLRQKWRFDTGLTLAAAVRKGQMWTVGDVFSLMIYEPADAVKDTADKLLGYILSLYSSLITPRALSKIQLKRRVECLNKFEHMVEETLGERRSTMYYVAVMMTDPEHQGHGYGSALLRLQTTLADAHGRASWLVSSNIKNTGFYNSLGFVTKAQVSVGDEDPDWTEPPVVVSLMIREVPEKVVRASKGSCGTARQ